MEQISFSFNMSTNCFTYLYPTQYAFIYFSDGVTFMDSYTVKKTDRPINTIYALNNEMIILNSATL